MSKAVFNASKAPADGGKQFLRVREIVEHFPGLRTFVFEADGVRTKRVAPQRAGNYIALTADAGESRVTRAYTLASSPKEAESGVYISTVKKAGILSSRLVDEVRVGDVLEASRPAGCFVYDAAGDRAHVVGVAGGAGITSMLSMAKAAEEGSEPFTMTLFFCVQNAYEFLFKDVLDGMKSGRVHVVYVVENDAPEWAESGVFTRELLHRYVGEECTLFACGGDALYHHIARELADDKSVRNMKFSANSVTDREDEEGRVFALTVHLAGRKYVIPARAAETVMVAMERAGLAALSQCRVGECGFCRSVAIGGAFTAHPAHDKRSAEDIAAGVIHPCCTYPESDAEIAVPFDPAAEVL